MDERLVLCGANAYEKKYYLNERFSALPESIKEELRILCVLFTEEVGGIFLMVFDAEGKLNLETDADEGDLLYDEVSSGLLIKEVQRKKQELFESLTLYYQIFILGEDPAELIKDL